MKIPNRSTKAGFTLVELLVVVAIGIIIASLSITSYTKVVSSGLLTTTTQSVIGLLDQARLTAISRNCYVEVRIYELPTAAAGPNGAQTQFRGMQTFLVTNSGYTQLTKLLLFPAPIVLQISDLSTPTGTFATSLTDHSTLLNSTVDSSLGLRTPGSWGTGVIPPIGTAPTLPSFQNNYSAITFRFTPKGSLSLDNTKQWFLTIVSATDNPTNSPTYLPKNYATLQIDGFTGKTSYYRP